MNKYYTGWGGVESEREPWLDGRLTINPHQSFYSDQSWHEMRYKSAETVKLYFEHEILRNHVTE